MHCEFWRSDSVLDEECRQSPVSSQVLRALHRHHCSVVLPSSHATFVSVTARFRFRALTQTGSLLLHVGQHQNLWLVSQQGADTHTPGRNLPNQGKASNASLGGLKFESIEPESTVSVYWSSLGTHGTFLSPFRILRQIDRLAVVEVGDQYYQYDV